ncbi:tetratricopeptide repeat protein [Peijinzhouia sedimentorum]
MRILIVIIATFSLLACNPSAEEFIQKGIENIDAEQPVEALNYLNRGVEAYPDNAQMHNLRGIAHFENMEYEAAVEDFTNSIKLDSTGYKPFFNRANALRELDRNFDAIQDYNIAIRFEPTLKDAYINRGFMYFKTEVFGQAYEDFQQAVVLDPNDVMAVYNKGRAALAIGNIDQAKVDFGVAINLDQNYAAAYYWLGLVHVGLEEMDMACSNFIRAKNLGHEEADQAIADFCSEE